MSADLPNSKAAPTLRPTRPRKASFATGLIVGAAVTLALLLMIAPPGFALLGAVPCCLLAAAGCVLLGRLELTGPRGMEPWRLDAWAVTVGGFSLFALGASIGAEAKPIGWLLVAMFVSLALAAVSSERPR